jgi:cyclophilin family peptidyl-prolyl cis-trans isomerase
VLGRWHSMARISTGRVRVLVWQVEGELYKELRLTTIVDGFTAPLTSGNFVDLVQKGFYDGYKIQRSDGFVVQTGDAKVT